MIEHIRYLTSDLYFYRKIPLIFLPVLYTQASATGHLCGLYTQLSHNHPLRIQI
jgi:hypothetical protein